MLDFLTLEPTAFGVDISDFSVKIARLKRKGKNFDLACIGEESIPAGLVEAGEIKDEPKLADIIRRTVSQAKGQKIKTREVISSLPDEKVFLKLIQLPKMTGEELKKAVPFEAENHIPIPIKESYFDFEMVEPLVDHLDHCDVLIAAVPQRIVDSYARTLKMAGLNPIAFDIESLSISRALVKNWLAPRPILLVDLAATRTVMIIFSGKSVRFSSSVSFSSEGLTKAIASELKINFEEAKKMQRDYGIEAKPIIQLQERTGDDKLEREIFNDYGILQILTPFLSQLVLEIRNFIEFYQSHTTHEHLPLSGQEIKRILLSGGGANLKGLDRYLAKELDVSVAFGNPWTNILSDPEARVPEEYLRKSLSYANTLGLALRGIINEENQ